jgi:hypothetical protein
VISSTSSSILYIQKTRSISAQSNTLSLKEFVALLRSIDHDASSAHRLTAMQQSNPFSFLSFASQVVLTDVLPVDLVSCAIVLIGGTLAVRSSLFHAIRFMSWRAKDVQPTRSRENRPDLPSLRKRLTANGGEVNETCWAFSELRADDGTPVASHFANVNLSGCRCAMCVP